MTNEQKTSCRHLAANTNYNAAHIARLVGCEIKTAKKYIDVFRPKKASGK